MARYTNLDGSTVDKGPADILKWQTGRLLRKRRPSLSNYTTPRVENRGADLLLPNDSLTWIGHATFALKLGGKLIATDPIWSERIHTIRRQSRPGIGFAEMPALDVVTVSHSHFDHLDLPTLKRIGPKALYVVPNDVGEILTAAGLPHVVELSWFESVTVGDVTITLVPAQHWSMRSPWDKNQRLWGGFVFEHGGTSLYHSGDTGFSESMFRAIHERFPNLGWAMLPIGAYDPEWFMKAQHMGPEDAADAFAILGAKRFVAMHWGTFSLTDEPIHEPPIRLKAAWEKRSLAEDRLYIPALGETTWL